MYYIREKEGKNENLKKEGKMRIGILISIYTVHFAILKMYTKFENTGSNRTEKSVTEISMEKKKNEQIKGLISNMWLFFFVTQYNSSLSSFVPNFRILTQVVAEKSLTKFFSIGEKEKRTNKGTDKQYVAVLLLHNTYHHYQALYQISES